MSAWMLCAMDGLILRITYGACMLGEFRLSYSMFMFCLVGSPPADDPSPQSSRSDEGLLGSRMVIYRGVICSKPGLVASLPEDAENGAAAVRRRSNLMRCHRAVQSDEEY